MHYHFYCVKYKKPTNICKIYGIYTKYVVLNGFSMGKIILRTIRKVLKFQKWIFIFYMVYGLQDCTSDRQF